ncbi:MAG: DUF4837 family protein [Gemmatimonadota bacterium]
MLLQLRLRVMAPSLVFPFALALAGCDLPRAYGDANAIIVAAAPEVWTQTEATFRDAMEPTILTVRDERPFRITYQDPMGGQAWGNLRRFREVLVIGRAEDPWIAEPLALLQEGAAPEPPAIFQVDNVWSRGQTVSVLLLPAGDAEASVAQLAPALQEILDRQFRQHALARMFASGSDQPLADSLFANTGFSLNVPQVYRMEVRDSLYRFRNDFPSPRELIREIWVTWESPIPEANPTREELASWRTNLSSEQYNDPQLLDTAMVAQYRGVTVNGLEGVEFQAAWVNAPGGWPAGGPFIVRAVRCPSEDRLYYMDAWLYAPGRDKYEYMIQLETILNSFRCR